MTSPTHSMHSYSVAFILAPHRSGSTLLDNLLASHPSVISVGEVDKLRAYALQDRRQYDPQQPLTCSCGEPVASCAFWKEVERFLGTPLADLSLQWPLVRYARDSLSTPQRLLQRSGLALLKRRPALFRSTVVQRAFHGRIGTRDNWRLFDAIHSASGAPCIVDASKATYRYRLLRNGNEDSVRAIFLCRDYRAVTYSLMRRGLSMEEAVAKWRQGVRRIEEMVCDLPSDQLFRVTYEELCRDPTTTIRRVWQYLRLHDCEIPEARSITGMHHISGSPSKVDPNRQMIRRDDSHVGAFDPAQLEYLRNSAYPYATRWGYN